jgi:O-antigen/teichoic acid export membrane protein
VSVPAAQSAALERAPAAATPTVESGVESGIVRGGLLLMTAKLAHIATGFFLYAFLLAILTASLGAVDGTAAFGVWGTVFAVINPINMMFATGALQLVSQLAASHGRAFGGAFYRAARTQAFIGIAAFAALLLLAPVIASELLHDPAYTPYLRLAALIPVFYGLRALYQGYLNGVRRFSAQAWIDIGASVARMTFVLGGAALGLGVLGAIGGFGFAALLLLVVAALWIRPPRGATALQWSTGRLLSFQSKVMLATLATYYLTTFDLLAVKAFAAADPLVADRLAGYFTAGQRLAQIPMTLVVALVYVMFPLIAKNARSTDATEGARVLRLGMRAMLLLLVPATVILAASAHESLLLVFPSIARTMTETGDTATVVSQPFEILVIAYVLYTFLLTASTLITADGRPGTALAIVLATLVLARLFTWQGALQLGPQGAALGSGAAWLAGSAAAAAVLLRRYGTIVSLASAGRIVFCGAVLWLAAQAWPAAGLTLLVKDALLGVLFITLVIAVREVSIAELKGLLGAILPSGARARAR